MLGTWEVIGEVQGERYTAVNSEVREGRCRGAVEGGEAVCRRRGVSERGQGGRGRFSS